MYSDRGWLDTKLRQFMREVDSCIRWYNDYRIKFSLRPEPLEYRQRL